MDYSKRRFVYVLICAVPSLLLALRDGLSLMESVLWLGMVALFSVLALMVVGLPTFIVFSIVPHFLHYLGFMPDEYMSSDQLKICEDFGVGVVLGAVVIAISFGFPIYRLFVPA
jgi:hypothetical protein